MKVTCEICNEVTYNAFYLKRHKASVHGVIPHGSFKCKHCPLFFKGTSALLKHVTTKHRWSVKMGQKMLKKATNRIYTWFFEENVLFKCKHCPLFFKGNSALLKLKHVTTKHRWRIIINGHVSLVLFECFSFKAKNAFFWIQPLTQWKKVISSCNQEKHELSLKS